jgi:hypothetical protein
MPIMLTQKLSSLLVEYGKTMNLYKQSQDLRKQYLEKASIAGQLLLEAQATFSQEGYCTAHPLVIKGKEYTSFKALLKDFQFIYEALVGEIDPDLVEYFSESHAAKTMMLAKNWEVLQQIPDFFQVKHVYRLSRTLEIVSWFKRKLQQNPDVDPNTFTCELYWQEIQAAREAKKKEAETKPSYKELEAEVSYLRSQMIRMQNLEVELEISHRRIEELEALLSYQGAR